ncbi:hypothetical protein [Embleya sp. NPDC001921]
MTGPVDHAVRDVFGRPVRVGDVVASWSASDLLPIHGPVVAISETTVTIRPTAGTEDHASRPPANGEQEIPVGQLVLVTPRADDPACTCSCSLSPHPLGRPHADECPALDPATRAACCAPAAEDTRTDDHGDTR